MLSGWRPKRGALSSKGKLILGIIGGSVLGFFAGLIGRGGGTFVVPLLFIAGLDPKTAAATSAFVVTLSGISSFASHIATSANPDWRLWSLCVLAVFIGSQLGSRFMASRLKGRRIKLIFGLVLLFISAMLIIKDVL